LKKIVLKKAGIEKIKALNPWIYNQEIKEISKSVKDGDIVKAYSPNGKFLAIGYINTKSKITFRVLSFEEINIDKDFFYKNIEEAYQKRLKRIKNSNAFRIIHSEADNIPGLIVDYYNGYLSVAFNTLGIEQFRDIIIKALIDIISPKGIYEKSDEKAREKEGLQTEEKIIYGEVPEDIYIEENNIKFRINLKSGQKTGFFLDQRKNRKIVSEYIEKDFKVLDLFSNVGGFSLYAKSKGASLTKAVDISEEAIKQIDINAKLNNTQIQAIKADAFDFLREERKNKNIYNMIIIDPPAFAKSKNQKEGALRGFKDLILNSLKILQQNGYIAVFSCSHHIDLEDLKNTALSASVDTKTKIEILEHLFQDIDHPFILNIPNSLYLKGLLIQKL